MTSRLAALLAVLALVLVGALGLAAAMQWRRTPSLGVGTVLVLDVPAVIAESPRISHGLNLSRFRRPEPTLWELTFAIREAATDARVRALVLHVDQVEWGWARIAELRSAVAVFRAAGKPVYASMRAGGEAEFLIASAGDRLAAPATATLQLDGLTASALFFRGTYDKLGISPNFEHVGTFKSAVESYTRSNMSPESRQALEALLDDQFGQLVDTLAAARGLQADSLRALLDEGPYLGARALTVGLVDTLLEDSELDSFAVQQAGRGVRALRFERYLDYGGGTRSDAPIALVVASGTIVPGRSTNSPFSGEQIGSETLLAQLRDLRTRGSVEAVVLRIDSPGGDGGASEVVWREIRRLRAVKPVVVSMSDVAASGGYYIASAADSIVAEPGTLTGSIGVFGGKLNLLGLYRKAGLNVETVARGRHAEMFSAFRDFSPEEATRFREQLESFYRVFLSRVSEGRQLTPDSVDAVGQGRVWTGRKARELGLVDRLGGLELALEIAARRAGLDPVADTRVVRMVPEPGDRAFESLFAQWMDEDDTEAIERLMTRPEWRALRVARSLPAGVVLALLPFELVVR